MEGKVSKGVFTPPISYQKSCSKEKTISNCQELEMYQNHHLKKCVPMYTQFFYKGWLIRDGNKGLVGIPEILRDVD